MLTRRQSAQAISKDSTEYRMDAQETKETYNLSFRGAPTAVCRGQRRGTGLWVPRHEAILRGTADWQCVDTVCVAVTTTAITITTSITWRPDKDWAEATTTLSTPNTFNVPRCKINDILIIINIIFRQLMMCHMSVKIRHRHEKMLCAYWVSKIHSTKLHLQVLYESW